MSIYPTSINQSIKDICWSCYASQDLVGQLMSDNEDIFKEGFQTVVPPGTEIYYDPLLIQNVALQRQLVDLKINTLIVP